MPRFTFTACLCLLALCGVLYAKGASDGQAVGVVIEQGKDKEKPASGMTVRLAIVKDRMETAGAETKTDASGQYRFSHLDTDPAITYIARADRNGVPFPGLPGQFSGGKTLRMRAIQVQSTIPEPKNIRANEVILIEFTPAHVAKVMHSIRFVNVGDITYDPREHGATPIEWTLPTSGSALEFGAGLDAENTEVDARASVLRIRRPIPPGDVNPVMLEFSYTITQDESRLHFSLPTNILRESVTLLLRDQNFSVRSTQLEKQPSQTIDGTLYDLYRGGPFTPGEPLVFAVSGFWTPKEIARAFVFGGFALVLAAAIFLAFRSRKAKTPSPQMSKNACLERLVELERTFRAGTIAPPEYRIERERWMDVLLDLQHTSAT